MYRNLHARSLRRPGAEAPGEDDQYDRFQGKIFIVDLTTIDPKTEYFEGRKWLENCLRNGDGIGWSVEWQPDRTEGANHPIALMQFATADTALLFRTHQTRNWLPVLVEKLLMGTECKKYGVGVEGTCKQKMQATFNFFPAGVVDLADVARNKGIEAQGLKALGEHFNMRIRKAERIARSNWSNDELTKEQVQYAAEDAYFAHLLREKLDDLDDLAEDKGEGYDNINQGILQIKKEWEGIIKRKSDGLWCVLCDKGPMNVPMIVERHIEGKKHQQKVEAQLGVTPGNVEGARELPEKYITQGIIAGDGINGIKIGDYKCMICNAGPFQAITVVEQHINSKKHLKAAAPKEVGPDATSGNAAKPADPFGDHEWNFPAYIKPDEENKQLICGICEITNTATPMRMHLGGHKHGARCRARGCEEMIFVKERDRLEYVLSGAPVVREGFKAPRVSKLPKPSTDGEPEVVSSSPKDADGSHGDVTEHAFGNNNSGPTAANTILPKGWEEKLDPATGCPYYFHYTTGVAQWQRPEAGEAQFETASAGLSQGKPSIREPLLEGWEEYLDPNSGDAYFYNTVSKTCQWDRPSAAAAQEEDGEAVLGLPPGWVQVWAREDNRYYYADTVEQQPQWTQPPAYVHQPWAREIDPQGKAFWSCTEVARQDWFYEDDQSWSRMVDSKHRFYWVNSSTGRRFFEKSPLH